MSSTRKTVLLAALIGALLPLASAPAAAANERPQIVHAFANAPGAITVNWSHSGSGVYWFVVEQESPSALGTVGPDYRTLTVTSLQPSRTYRYRVCAVYAFNRKCSDEDGVGLVAVTTMPPEQTRPAPPTGTPPSPPVPPWAPRPIATPVIKASLSSSQLGAAKQVNLAWANPVDSQQFITLMRIDWYRNGAFFATTRKGEAVDQRNDPNETTRYKVCVENAKGRVCSSEVTVAPVPTMTTTVFKGGSSSAGKRAFEAAASQAADPSACRAGYVWRVARASDLVCVTPASRDMVATENRNAAQGVQPGAAPYCRPGLVWREAFSGDGVCVIPQRRDQVYEENRLGSSRRA